MRAWRITFATAGILLGLFGAFRLLTQVSFGNLLVLALWLIGAVVVHDGILSPTVVGIGVLLHRIVPVRARRYIQGGLIAGGLITVVAVPLILRSGSGEPQAKAILQQNFTLNLTVLLAVVAAVSLVLYAVRVARDREPGPRPQSSADTA